MFLWWHGFEHLNFEEPRGMLLFPYLVFREIHWIDWVLVYSFKFAKLLELFLQFFFLNFLPFPLFLRNPSFLHTGPHKTAPSAWVLFLCFGLCFAYFDCPYYYTFRLHGNFPLKYSVFSYSLWCRPPCPQGVIVFVSQSPLWVSLTCVSPELLPITVNLWHVSHLCQFKVCLDWLVIPCIIVTFVCLFCMPSYLWPVARHYKFYLTGTKYFLILINLGFLGNNVIFSMIC